YYQGSGDVMKAIRITSGQLQAPPFLQSSEAFPFPGSQPSISANGTSNAIAWALQVNGFGQNLPSILHAYNATTLQQELYRSDRLNANVPPGQQPPSQRDRMGGSVKFTFPIVTNGKVFGGANGTLDVFGLFPPVAAVPVAPSDLTGTPLLGGTQIQLSWANNATNATGVKILRSTDGVNFAQVNTVARNVTTFTDTGLVPSTLYFYQVVATNQLGDSPPSNTASIRTRIASPILQVADVCIGSLTLSWTATANDHYDIERSAAGGPFTLIATVDASQTTFTDTGLPNGTFSYRVTAASVFPEGADSAVSSV